MKAKAFIKKQTLDNIANAIRSKRNISNELSVNEFKNEIELIQSGVDLSSVTLENSNQILENVKAFDKNGIEITGSLKNSGIQNFYFQENLPEIKCIATFSDNSVITENASKNITLQLNTQNITAPVTPGSNNKSIVSSGKYCTSDITIKGDPNLLPENIAGGNTIFNVKGTAASTFNISTIDSSDGIPKIYCNETMCFCLPCKLDDATISYSIRAFGTYGDYYARMLTTGIYNFNDINYSDGMEYIVYSTGERYNDSYDIWNLEEATILGRLLIIQYQAGENYYRDQGYITSSNITNIDGHISISNGGFSTNTNASDIYILNYGSSMCYVSTSQGSYSDRTCCNVTNGSYITLNGRSVYVNGEVVAQSTTVWQHAEYDYLVNGDVCIYFSGTSTYLVEV